ncbi:MULTISPECIES: hypothetical protein [unclassified Pseudomonas]|uniref:hypothetical protein n=1 Tax=unclassified Pseudomonas TaxID=196821 RepID=UPI00244C8657|nr:MULTISPECIES: hypothetical protein [unclassified Pseudomonas]MDG9928772.1 hypothetical protein [Pseudomonas sp. GD04042]MDH0481841.1 hypothetical protein [Pseudomonas sp. GD04015]MDH0603213.1 hypothetical protein [Pseudomonas sp. GD03869]
MTAIPAGGIVSASDLLNSQAKKFTMDMPAEVHYELKQIAAIHRTTVKELMLEAVNKYIFPTYAPPKEKK